MVAPRTCAILLFFVAVSVMVISSNSWRVEAARPAPDCFDVGESFLTEYPSMYEKARATMATWMARLPSGPSPKGPGH
ncbi:hypothetical protein Cni_G05197 [Canna indica]|uniref:Transmembrane protein n=1 Tax=Canna indica TaxID=4628 RepID=A0AAQ3Q4Q2_9LILI|nr:hypothetical protein Cni_G05197 [Canna indica]